MNIIGTCSACGGPVVASENKEQPPKCGTCGAEAEAQYGPTVKMKSDATPGSIDTLRGTLEAVVDRWCPKTNPKGEPTGESFDRRMVKALLHLNAFEIDYRRVLAGGKALNTNYPLVLPVAQKT